MTYLEQYNKWLNSPHIDPVLRAELEAVKGDDAEIKDRFFMPLQFDTAGLRGILGAGINRMNIHVGKGLRHVSWTLHRKLCQTTQTSSSHGK